MSGLLRQTTKPSIRPEQRRLHRRHAHPGWPTVLQIRNPPSGHRREHGCVGLAVGLRRFDMHGPIAAQAVVERNEDALQQRILLSQCVTGTDRLSVAEHACTCTDRRTGWPATPGRRGKLDRRFVDHPLELARRAPGTDEGVAPSTAIYTGVLTAVPLLR
jgi:hypothetical protein